MPKDDDNFSTYLLGILDQEAESKLPISAQEQLIADEVIAAIALSAEPIAPSQSSRDRLLAALEPDTRFEAFVERLAEFFDLGAKRIRELLAHITAVPHTPWQSSGLPGLYLLPFQGGPRRAKAGCQLIYMEPGRVFPPHRHLGDEWGFILQGWLQEDSGREYGPGDLIHKTSNSSHSFQAQGNEAALLGVALHGKIEWLHGE